MPKDEEVDIPSLKLDQDEVSERRATSTPQKRQLNPPPTKVASAQMSAAAYKKPSLAGIYILLILILAAAAGAGYWLWQQNLQLREELSGTNLDHQLLAADVSANKQGETVEQTLKNHDSEIRKLWAIAYDKNRKLLSDHDDAIKTLQKKQSIMKDAVSTQTQRIAIQNDAYNDLEANYNKLIKSVADMDKMLQPIATDWALTQQNLNDALTKITALEGALALQKGNGEAQGLSLDRASQDIDSLKKKVDEIEKSSAGMSANELSSIKQTLSQYQEAINSNDAFRSQMNSQMMRLNKQINQLLLQQQLGSE